MSWGFVELEEMVVELQAVQTRNRGEKRTFVNPAGRLDNSNISSVLWLLFKGPAPDKDVVVRWRPFGLRGAAH